MVLRQIIYGFQVARVVLVPGRKRHPALAVQRALLAQEEAPGALVVAAVAAVVADEVAGGAEGGLPHAKGPRSSRKRSRKNRPR